MSRSKIMSLVVLGGFLTVTLQSIGCKKKKSDSNQTTSGGSVAPAPTSPIAPVTPITPVTPDVRDLAGSWKGTTSNSGTISFIISNGYIHDITVSIVMNASLAASPKANYVGYGVSIKMADAT